MRKIHLRKNLTDYIINNKLIFLFSALVFVVGTVIGSLSALSVKSGSFDYLSIYIENFISAYTLQYVNYTDLFKFVLYTNIKLLLFMWLSGLWVGFIPLGMLQLFTKGYKLSFSIVFIIQLYRGKGILFVLVSIVPQLLMLIPIMLFYAVFNVNFSFMLRQRRKSSQNLWTKDVWISNLFILFIMCIVLVIDSLIESFIIPPILKPICTFLNY